MLLAVNLLEIMTHSVRAVEHCLLTFLKVVLAPWDLYAGANEPVPRWSDRSPAWTCWEEGKSVPHVSRPGKVIRSQCHLNYNPTM